MRVYFRNEPISNQILRKRTIGIAGSTWRRDCPKSSAKSSSGGLLDGSAAAQGANPLPQQMEKRMFAPLGIAISGEATVSARRQTLTRDAN
jgi:hypothetical protein